MCHDDALYKFTFYFLYLLTICKWQFLIYICKSTPLQKDNRDPKTRIYVVMLEVMTAKTGLYIA